MAEPQTAQPSRIEVLLQPPPGATHDSSLADLAGVLAWPVAAIIAVVLLRKALVEALGAFASRAQKLSVGVFAVELAAGAAKSWGGPALDEIRDTASTAVVGDSSGSLIASLQDTTPADYAVVDLGTGSEWITSRLYLVATLVARMRGLRVILFVGGEGNLSTLIGWAEVERVRWALAAHFPWYEVALADAYHATVFPMTAATVARPNLSFDQRGRYEPWRAGNIAQAYRTALQVRGGPAPIDASWIELGPNVWERAEWLNVQSIRAILGGALCSSPVIQDGDLPNEQLARRLLRASGQFVPIVDTRGTLLRLVNRATLVDRTAALVADERS